MYGKLDEVLGHFRRYSSEQLRGRLEEAGFTVERILNFNRVSRPAWYVSGRIFRRDRISRLQLHIFDRMVWLWRRADRFIPWIEGERLAAACRPKEHLRLDLLEHAQPRMDALGPLLRDGWRLHRLMVGIFEEAFE